MRPDPRAPPSAKVESGAGGAVSPLDPPFATLPPPGEHPGAQHTPDLSPAFGSISLHERRLIRPLLSSRLWHLRQLCGQSQKSPSSPCPSGTPRANRTNTFAVFVCKDTISPLCSRVSTPFPLWRAAAMWAQPREGGATQVIPAQPVQRRTGGRSPHRRGTVLPPETAFCPFSPCRVGRKPVSPAVRSGETPPSGCRFSSSPTVGPLKRRSARLTPPAPQKRGPFPVGRALSFFVFSLYSSSNWPV